MTNNNINLAVVNNTIVTYMATGVGSAESSYTVDGSLFTITYVGLYDCDLKQPSKLQSLARVLGNYPNPILGGYNCTQKCFETFTGFAYVTVTIPLNETTPYETGCNAVYNYLSSQNYLDSSIIRRDSFIAKTNSGYLELFPKIYPAA